jgi:hypothetical protein
MKRTLALVALALGAMNEAALGQGPAPTPAPVPPAGNSASVPPPPAPTAVSTPSSSTSKSSPPLLVPADPAAPPAATATPTLIPISPALPPPTDFPPVVEVVEPVPFYQPRWIDGGKGWFVGAEARIYQTSIDAEDGAGRVRANVVFSPRVFVGYRFASDWAIIADMSELRVSRTAGDGIYRSFRFDNFHLDLQTRDWGWDRARFHTDFGLEIASVGFSRVSPAVFPDGPTALAANGGDLNGLSDAQLSQLLDFSGSFTGVGPRVGLTGRFILIDDTLSLILGGDIGSAFGDHLEAVNVGYRAGLEWSRKSFAAQAGFQGEIWTVADDRTPYWSGPEKLATLNANGFFINALWRF